MSVASRPPFEIEFDKLPEKVRREAIELSNGRMRCPITGRFMRASPEACWHELYLIYQEYLEGK